MSNEKIEYLNLNLLHPFENNPFQSVDESEYDELRDSILEFGIITPLIVNKSDNGYEIISGHRRWQIAKELKLETVPVYVREFSKEEAVINFVDCNLSREKILPSEKARAYKMKHDAIKKQGARTDLTSSQVGTKFRSDEMLAVTMPDSRMQIQRYIRLNNLQPALLDMVDEKRISFTPCEGTHYVRADSLEQIVMLELRSLASFLVEDEEAFADILEAKTNKSILNQQKFLESSIDKSVARTKEIAVMYEKLFEKHINGIVNEESFMQLSQKYETERDELKLKIRQYQEELSEIENLRTSKEQFTFAVRKFMQMETLTPALLNELIEKIEVHSIEGKGKNKTQKIIIHYRFVGVIDNPIKEENIVLEARQGVAVEYLTA